MVAVGSGSHGTFDAAMAGSAVASFIREHYTSQHVGIVVPHDPSRCPSPDASAAFHRRLQGVFESLLVEMRQDIRCAYAFLVGNPARAWHMHRISRPVLSRASPFPSNIPPKQMISICLF